MSFDWAQYLFLAQDLAGLSPSVPPSQEARLRSAVSRAYYAAFCEARNVLRKKGRYTPAWDDNVHTYVRDQFRRDPNPVYRKIGDDLNRLRIDRNEADYSEVVRRLPTTVRRDVELARRLIGLLTRL